MRIAYLDCFAGIAGDMFLGALLQAGVPAEVLHEATAALNIGASLKIETVDRSGISAMKVHVLEGEELADGEHSHDHQREHTHSHQPQTQHLHKGGHHHHEHKHDHDHPHEHSHTHGRSLSVICGLIQAAPLHESVRHTAIRAFELLARLKRRSITFPSSHIHFHEVGAVDAIVDIVAAQRRRASSPDRPVGTARTSTWAEGWCSAHTATSPCLHRQPRTFCAACRPTRRHVQKELVTPTGAALLRVLDPFFGPQPPMKVDAIGYGAGTRNPEGFPNVLRLSVGESLENSASDDVVTVLETALDDLSPQVIAYAAEKVLAAGALDVMLTPVVMKKGRPGTLFTVLCDPAQSEALQQLLLRETSTLGIRVRQDRRVRLQRSHVEVATAFRFHPV